MAIYIGTAGWSIPGAHKEKFSATGSQLVRYASQLNGAEINSSFYRPHAAATYERWASAVPAAFRFAVKMPKLISHERLLLRARDPLARFLDETSGLGRKRGPLLLQLPPSFGFDSRRVGRFLELLRRQHGGAVVCEPRHATWTTPEADRLLSEFKVPRVAADPPRAPGLCDPGGWDGLVYYRWHGSPKPYFSCYSAGDLTRLMTAMTRRSGSVQTWCIFDNTGSGSAAGNALDLINLLNAYPTDRRRVARRP